jgi:hypothetical protein
MTYDYAKGRLDAMISVPNQLLKFLPEKLADELCLFESWSRGRIRDERFPASDGELIGLYLKIVDMIDENCATPSVVEQRPIKGKVKEISKAFQG